MSRKSTEPDSGSLDMLLDAMSNAFGSIVLICILLIINLSNKTDEIVANVEHELTVETNAPYFATQSEMQDENATLEIEIEALENIDLESVLAEKTAAENALKEKLQEHAKVLEKIREGSSESINIEKIDTEKLSENIKTLNELSGERNKLEKAKAEKIARVVAIKSNAVPLSATAPIGSSAGSYVWVIIKDNYLMPLDFTKANTQSFMKKDSSGNMHVLFDPSQALSISKFLTHLDSLSASSVYLSFIVNTDTASYNTLRQLINPVSSKGFKYYWIPNIGGYLSSFSKSGLSPEGTY